MLKMAGGHFFTIPLGTEKGLGGPVSTISACLSTLIMNDMPRYAHVSVFATSLYLRSQERGDSPTVLRY